MFAKLAPFGCSKVSQGCLISKTL